MANPKHSSESVEHYTPSEYIEAARSVMGAITLDPASTHEINTNLVKATEFFDEKRNGFSKPWFGNVFLNPPGGCCDAFGRRVKHGKSSQKMWWRKLALEWLHRDVDEAVFIGFSLELLQMTQIEGDGVPIPLDFPLCFPSQRMRFLTRGVDGKLSPGTQPTHANVIVYLPKRERQDVYQKFIDAFGVFGRVQLPNPRKKSLR